jgi:histidinol dehydrogenase
MNNSTLVMVAVLAAVAMLSAAVVVVPIQQVSAQDTTFSFK